MAIAPRRNFTAMKIKLKTRAMGPPGSVSGSPGDILDVDDEIGAALVAARAAENLDPPKREPAKAKKVVTDGTSPDDTSDSRASVGRRGTRRAKRNRQ